jgi:sarcosine oxidase delta subunit
MPLTKEGRKVLKNYQEQYGEEKGKQYFYASINKGTKGSEKWHKGKGKRKYSAKDLTS